MARGCATASGTSTTKPLPREARGLQVVTPTPELQQQWRDAARAIYPKVRGDLIPAADFDEVMALVRERRARGTGK